MKRIDVQKIIGSKNTLRIKNTLFFQNHPEYKSLIKKNSEFKGIHNGERCFILGNGPSLSKVDLSLLKDEVTFSVNQLPRNLQFSELHTTYHMWMDNRFFDISKDRPEDMELLDVMKKVNTRDNKPTVFYNIDAFEMVKKFGLDKELDIRYIAHTYIKDIESLLSKNDIDFTCVTPSFSTVVHYLICIAVYMGFKEIYLLGCDCTGIIGVAKALLNKGEEASYVYTISNNEKKRLERIATNSSFEKELRYQLEIFEIYRWLEWYCNRNNARLINCTEGTLLNSIPFVSLDEVLND